MLAKSIYTLVKASGLSKDYGLKDQIQRAAVSVGSNIAEGFERQGNKEFLQFLYIAKGSCGEFRSQINRAYDAQFISKETYEQMYADCRKLGAGILSFIKSLKSFESKGSKYVD